MKELIDKFPEGQKLYETSNSFNKLVKCISQGMSLYEAFSILAQKELETQEIVKKLLETIPMHPFVLPKD